LDIYFLRPESSLISCNILPGISDYNKEVKRLKVKVSKMYNKRTFGQPYQAELKRLSKELLVAKKKVQDIVLCSVLQNECSCWTQFYKYVKRRKGNRESIPEIKNQNGKFVTDPKEKANSLNSYYVSLFSCERNNPQIQSKESGKPFIISINIIKKQLSAIGKKKSVGPDGIPGEILKLGGEAMIL